jgi:hypothetical protein
MNKKSFTGFCNIKCLAARENFLIIEADNLLLINIYLPSSRNHTDREKIIFILENMFDYIDLSETKLAIIGGDTNTNILETNPASKCITNKLKEFNFIQIYEITNDYPVNDFSFVVNSRNAQSFIDHFFVYDSSSIISSQVKIIHNIANLSDHLPVNLSIKFNSVIKLRPTDCSEVTNTPNNFTRFDFHWSKADKLAYYEYTRVELNNIFNLLNNNNSDELQSFRPDILTKEGLNTIYKNIVHTLLNGSINYVPTKESIVKKLHWWDTNLKNSKLISIDSYKKWIDVGRPTEGLIFNDMLSAKKAYKKQINKRNLK